MLERHRRLGLKKKEEKKAVPGGWLGRDSVAPNIHPSQRPDKGSLIAHIFHHRLNVPSKRTAPPPGYVRETFSYLSVIFSQLFSRIDIVKFRSD